MNIIKHIKQLHNRGFNPAFWIFDQEINGAWYGKIGSNVFIKEYRNAIVLFDHGERTKL